MTDTLAMLVPALATALLHFLWQGALVALLAWLALAVLRDARPQVRYAVACVALFACVLLPAWNLMQALGGDGAAAGMQVAMSTSDGVVSMPRDPGDMLRLSPSPSTNTLVVALWAAGVAVLSLRMACGLWWVRRVRREAGVDTTGAWQACVDRLAPRLGIARRVVLRLVREGDGPITAGWWRPVVLLPFAIAARMPADAVEALIAHELAHVRRHDYLLNLLQCAVEALLFYHPVVWWLSHRIRIERELVADDLAGNALGDRRRLAMALSGLAACATDRPASRLPIHPSHFAPAAHGGHLMSRIQQLVRPRRAGANAAFVALPVIGLALAGAAFYAHARLAPAADAAAGSAPTVIAQAAPAAKAQGLPAPAAKPGVQVLPAPAARPAAHAAVDDDNHPGYALVSEDRDHIRMYGDMDDADGIRRLRDRIDGDFLWFRRDGKSWILRDPATLARANEAWRETDAIQVQMHALEARMQPLTGEMQALSTRMEALTENNAFESPETRAAIERIEALGEQAQALAERQEALAMRMQQATAAEQAQLDRDRAQLERQQATLHRDMERHSATLATLNARMQAQQEPMEALSREMEAASEPMHAIGRDMEALGQRIEREAEIADRQMRQLIDEAWRNGRAQPAPVRQ